MKYLRLKIVNLTGPSGAYQKVGLITQRLVGDSRAGGDRGEPSLGLVTQRLVGER